MLAVAAGVAVPRDRRWAWLCALFALLTTTMTSIVITHRTEGTVEKLAVAAEQLAWAVGPTLYHYVRMSLGFSVSLRRAWPHFLLPGLILLIGTPLILLWDFEPVPPEMLVAQQIAYSAAAFFLFLDRPDPSDRSPLGFWWPLAVLAAMAGVHVAQLIRVSRWGALNQDIVPAIGAGAMIVLTLMALLLAHHRPRSSVPYAKSLIGAGRAQAIFEEAVKAMKDEALYRRPDLTLGDLASRINVGVHHLSQSLSRAGGTSFNDLVSRLRVEEAKRLLRESANRTVAVEPLGMEAGFRSRSAFYSAFRDQTGVTPAEYRRLESGSVSCPLGEDTDQRD